MVEFPVDVIFEILCKIPAKILLKLRGVSKSWCKIIDDPFFQNTQYHHGGGGEQETPLIIPSFSVSPRLHVFYAALDSEEDRSICAAKIPMTKFKVKVCDGFGSGHGLLYFVEHRGRIIVSNPLLSEFRVLPPTNIEQENWWWWRWNTYGLGFDSSTKTFKMVCNIYREDDCFITLLHYLGTTLWRTISSTVPPRYQPYCRSVFVHGVLHWLARPFESRPENYEWAIVTFDVSKETFKLISGPDSCSNINTRLISMLDIKGDLAVVDQSCKSSLNIWTMNFEKKLWSKVYTITMTAPDGSVDHELTRFIGIWKQDEILLKTRQGYLSYSIKTDEIKYKHVSGFNCDEQVYIHRGSLISISDATKVSLV